MRFCGTIFAPQRVLEIPSLGRPAGFGIAAACVKITLCQHIGFDTIRAWLCSMPHFPALFKRRHIMKISYALMGGLGEIIVSTIFGFVAVSCH